jgi:invasion protein IalB
MMKILSLAAATAIASSLLIGSALAQTAAPAKTNAAEAKAPETATEKKARTAISLECSKQADEKKLKGKERKKFRSECKKTAADKAK